MRNIVLVCLGGCESIELYIQDFWSHCRVATPSVGVLKWILQLSNVRFDTDGSMELFGVKKERCRYVHSVPKEQVNLPACTEETGKLWTHRDTLTSVSKVNSVCDWLYFMSQEWCLQPRVLYDMNHERFPEIKWAQHDVIMKTQWNTPSWRWRKKMGSLGIWREMSTACKYDPLSMIWNQK